MKTITIDGEKFVKESDIAKQKIKAPSGDKSNPYMEPGCTYFVQTVTHYYTGRLVWVGQQELCFEDVCWIADTGKFSEFLAGKTHNESEPYPRGQNVIIGRGALVSMSPRELILEQK